MRKENKTFNSLSQLPKRMSSVGNLDQDQDAEIGGGASTLVKLTNKELAAKVLAEGKKEGRIEAWNDIVGTFRKNKPQIIDGLNKLTGGPNVKKTNIDENEGLITVHVQGEDPRSTVTWTLNGIRDNKDQTLFSFNVPGQDELTVLTLEKNVANNIKAQEKINTLKKDTLAKMSKKESESMTTLGKKEDSTVFGRQLKEIKKGSKLWYVKDKEHGAYEVVELPNKKNEYTYVLNSEVGKDLLKPRPMELAEALESGKISLIANEEKGKELLGKLPEAKKELSTPEKVQEIKREIAELQKKIPNLSDIANLGEWEKHTKEELAESKFPNYIKWLKDKLLIAEKIRDLQKKRALLHVDTVNSRTD